MSYLKRNINLLLLVVAVVLIGYSLSLTAYYQTTYNDVTGKYYERVQEYDQLIEDLQERENRLDEAGSEITRKTKDKEKLDELYTDLSGEKALTDAELVDTKTLLAKTKAELEDAEDSLVIRTEQLNSFVEDIDSVVEDLEDEYTILEEELRVTHSIAPVTVEELLADLDDYIDDLKGLT
ncbi:hypothetical protein HN662_06295 [Candidatus Woesearchaeota archaeon]|nr:hypothetical protein [Candidatus Woesearchaeota archaeon]